ncbi:hypothetical protein BG005_001431 [Podila minutissima]|nr:hypothetical protein BG005_001431 [Podila minutissima]
MNDFGVARDEAAIDWGVIVLLEDADVAEEVESVEEIDDGGAESIDIVRGPSSALVEVDRDGVEACFPKVGAPTCATFAAPGSAVAEESSKVAISSIGADVRTSMLI